MVDFLFIFQPNKVFADYLGGHMFRKYKIWEDAFALLQSSHVLLFKRITAGFLVHSSCYVSVGRDYVGETSEGSTIF